MSGRKGWRIERCNEQVGKGICNFEESRECYCRNMGAACTATDTKWGENGSASGHPSVILQQSLTYKAYMTKFV